MKRSPNWDRKRGYRVDVTVAEARKKLFAELSKDFGKFDIVFANAGISGRTPTGTTDEAIFEDVVHTNLNGAFFTVNSAAPLLNDNGSIIFNGSVHNYLGQPGLAAYAATKGGLVSMARAIVYAERRSDRLGKPAGRNRYLKHLVLHHQCGRYDHRNQPKHSHLW